MSTDPRTLQVTRHFDASPERVFDAWLKPETARQWLFSAPGGEIVRAEIDPRPGGQFLFTDRRNGQDVEHVGTYETIDRPRLLVFTFGVPKFSPLMTRVTVRITPQADGCELTLLHDDIPTEYFDRNREGWTKLLGALAATLATTIPPDDHGTVIAADAVRFQRLLPGPIERVWSYLVDENKRGQWLATGIMPHHVGADFQLTFHHAELSPHRAPRPLKFKSMPEAVTFPFRVTHFEPPHRLGLTWIEGADATHVLFELSEQGSQVLLTLTHTLLKTRTLKVEVAGGWHTHLAVLTERLNDRTPPAFWTLFGQIEEDYDRRFPK